MAPERLSAPRPRPLCPYPAYAQYKGTGDIDRAENFVCAADPPRRH